MVTAEYKLTLKQEVEIPQLHWPGRPEKNNKILPW